MTKTKIWIWVGVGLVVAYIVYKTYQAVGSVAGALNPLNWVKNAASAASTAATAAANYVGNAAGGASILLNGGVDQYVADNTVNAIDASGNNVTPAAAAAYAQAAGDNTYTWVGGVAYDAQGNVVPNPQ